MNCNIIDPVRVACLPILLTIASESALITETPVIEWGSKMTAL